MKKQLFLSLFLSTSISCIALATPTDEVDFTEVVTRISQNNYMVMDHALKVYQAKESIAVARGELFPSLNIWSILGAVLDPMSLITRDIAPFLVPSNWFRLKQAEKLYMAEKEGYRALWGNQLLNAKSLFLQLLSDQELYTQITEIRDQMLELESIATQREKLGGIKSGVAREIKIRRLSLDEDLMRLEKVLSEQKRSLAIFLGMPPQSNLYLKAVKLPDLSQSTLDSIGELELEVFANSPELAQHQFILESLKKVRGESQYSVLGLASNSRGTAGGVFDHLPIPSGLGFATAPSIRIKLAEKARLQLQMQGIKETLTKNLHDVYDKMELEINIFPKLKDRSDLSKEAFDQLKKRLQLGNTVDLLTLSETYRNRIAAAGVLLQSQFRYLMLQEKLDRLLWSNDYSKNAQQN